MHISADTWAVVLATATGPIAAILISQWREARSAKLARRLQVFRQLMATRRISISADHVNALNLVEVDFYGCKNVDTAWRRYKEFLDVQVPVEDDAWREKKERLLAELLFQIAKVLGFDIPALDIFKGGYAPKGWDFRDQRAMGALEYIHQLSTFKQALPWPRARL